MMKLRAFVAKDSFSVAKTHLNLQLSTCNLQLLLLFHVVAAPPRWSICG
jgi:hypothetical protein